VCVCGSLLYLVNTLVDTIVYHLHIIIYNIEKEILTLRWTKLVVRKWVWHLK